MFNYILRRILFFVPALFAISLITFFLSVNDPGDPVEAMLNSTDFSGKQIDTKIYNEVRRDLGLNLPIFYFTATSQAIVQDAFLIEDITKRQALIQISHESGRGQEAFELFMLIERLQAELIQKRLVNPDHEWIRASIDVCNTLTSNKSIQGSLNELDRIQKINDSQNMSDPSLNAFVEIRKRFLDLAENHSYANWFPKIIWHGFSNQYHRWASRFIQGDMGISYFDKRPVAELIAEAAPWTFLISVVSILIAFLISVPIGVWSSVHRGSSLDQGVSLFLFFLSSLPNFWIATLLIIFLGGGDYLNIFPVHGLGYNSTGDSFLVRFANTSHHLILPVFCWTYASIAYISRQSRSGMLSVLKEDYMLTAKAKGLSSKKVLWKHGFRNALLPQITLLSSVFPLLISGSFVLEYIFSIPGMGKLSYDALIARNFPVVYSTVMMASVMTMLGMLIADILYVWADPRISFNTKSKMK